MKLLILLMVATVACKSREQPTAGSDRAERAAPERAAEVRPDAAASAAGSDDVDPKRSAGENNMTGKRSHQGANCPAGMPGTETRIAMTPSGVDVTVTSKDARTIRRIIALAEFHMRGETAEKPNLHDTRHGGPGKIGYCPVFVSDMTAISMTIVDGGATVHVKARSPQRVPDLQELVKARASRLPGYLSS